MPKAGPQLLEPIMKVDVFAPDANVGDVHRRPQPPPRHDQRPGARGNVQRHRRRGAAGEMFGYIGTCAP